MDDATEAVQRELQRWKSEASTSKEESLNANRRRTGCGALQCVFGALVLLHLFVMLAQYQLCSLKWKLCRSSTTDFRLLTRYRLFTCRNNLHLKLIPAVIFVNAQQLKQSESALRLEQQQAVQELRDSLQQQSNKLAERTSQLSNQLQVEQQLRDQLRAAMLAVELLQQKLAQEVAARSAAVDAAEEHERLLTAVRQDMQQTQQQLNELQQLYASSVAATPGTQVQDDQGQERVRSEQTPSALDHRAIGDREQELLHELDAARMSAECTDRTVVELRDELAQVSQRAERHATAAQELQSQVETVRALFLYFRVLICPVCVIG